MAAGTYEYECNRAELLGIDPPNHVEWDAAENARKEKELTEEMTEIDIQDELISDSKSKMDEINNIISITQTRLNKFKKACGSLSVLLKIRGGIDEDQCGSASNANNTGDASEQNSQQSQSNEEINANNVPNENLNL